jgi:hypothetical protein
MAGLRVRFGHGSQGLFREGCCHDDILDEMPSFVADDARQNGSIRTISGALPHHVWTALRSRQNKCPDSSARTPVDPHRQ